MLWGGLVSYYLYVGRNVTETFNVSFQYDWLYICDWILENQPNCHTRPIPFFGQINGYTRTLHIHSASIRLG